MPVPIEPHAIYTKAISTTSMPFPEDNTELSLAMLCKMPFLFNILIIHLSVFSLATNKNPERKQYNIKLGKFPKNEAYILEKHEVREM